jgi:hypothetical protein
MGQYSVAMANYIGVAKNAELMQQQIGIPPLMAHL